MNDLIISIVKERILPASSEIIDFPSVQVETQLHRFATYITKIILDEFVMVTHWSLCNVTQQSKRDPSFLPEESRLTLALQTLFPIAWLKIAEQSPSHHLKLQRVIERYRFTLSEASIRRIHKIVEFLCFEIIETTVLLSGCKLMQELNSEDLQYAVEYDPVLKHIVYRHNIYFVTRYPSSDNVVFDVDSDLRISLKGARLLRVYVEEMIHECIRNREGQAELTIRDVDMYFKMSPSME